MIYFEDLDSRASAAIWSTLFITLLLILVKTNVTSIRIFFIATILRLIYSVGLGPTLWLMGAIQVEERRMRQMILTGIFLGVE